MPDDLYFMLLLDGFSDMDDNVLPRLQVLSPSRGEVGSYSMKGRMLEVHLDLKSLGEYTFVVSNPGGEASLRGASYTKRNSLNTNAHNLRRQ